MIYFMLVSDEHRECANWKLFKKYHRENLKKVLDRFYELGDENSKKYLIHLGDMVHSYKPPADISDPRGMNTLAELQQDFLNLPPNVTQIFLDGNHENRHGLYEGPTIPQYLQSFVELGDTVVHEKNINCYKIYEDGSKSNLLAVAYGYPVKGYATSLDDVYFSNIENSFKDQQPKLFFTHIPVTGVSVGGFELETKYDFEKVKEYMSNTAIFSGDIHKRQTYGSVNYVGSPYDTRSLETTSTVVNLMSPNEVANIVSEAPTFTIIAYNPDTKKISFKNFPVKTQCVDILSSIQLTGEFSSRSDLQKHVISGLLDSIPSTLIIKAKLQIQCSAANKKLLHNRTEAEDTLTNMILTCRSIIAADVSVVFGNFIDGIFLPEREADREEKQEDIKTLGVFTHNTTEQYYEYKRSISSKFSKEDWINVENELGVK